jgi:hypothetical protein
MHIAIQTESISIIYILEYLFRCESEYVNLNANLLWALISSVATVYTTAGIA